MLAEFALSKAAFAVVLARASTIIPPESVELIVIVFVVVLVVMLILLPAAIDSVSVGEVASINELFALIVANDCEFVK